MREVLDLKSVNIPYGVLHDQKLNKVRCVDNKMVFTFDIEIHPQDYDSDFYKTYQPYKHCDMIVLGDDLFINNTMLYSPVKSNGKCKGLEIKKADFADIINNAPIAAFVDCSVNGNEFNIELGVNYYNAKGKYKKYRNYCQCIITAIASTVEWNWY